MIPTYHSLAELHTEQRPIHWAMGFFDGVHVGHQRVIQSAATPGALRGVLTFEQHPLALLCPERQPALLTPDADHKARLLAQLGGADLLLRLPFTPDLAALSPTDFLDALGAASHVAGISVGANWHFGRGGSGSADLLQQEGARRGFTVHVCSLAQAGGSTVSSSRIRTELAAGHLPMVEQLLGHPFCIVGTVQHGLHMARQLGFPTANLSLAPHAALPPFGVYAVQCRVGDQLLAGIANLGCRPTVQEHAATPALEVHFPHRQLELYGRRLVVTLRHFLRAERRFDSIDDLKSQILRDIHSLSLIDFS